MRFNFKNISEYLGWTVHEIESDYVFSKSYPMFKSEFLSHTPLTIPHNKYLRFGLLKSKTPVKIKSPHLKNAQHDVYTY